MDAHLTTMARRDMRALLAATGETAVYRPTDGAARTVTAVVHRAPPTAGAPLRQPQAELEIEVVNDDEADSEYGLAGIAAASWRRTDVIEVPVVAGGDAQLLRLARIVHQSAGAVVFAAVA